MSTSASEVEAAAGYYDGRVSARREVTLSLEGESLRLAGAGVAASYPLARVEVTAGVGSIRRAIRLPDGGLCEVADQAFLAAVERRQGRGKVGALLHRWERSLPLAVAALVMTAAVVVIFMRFGVPALSRHVANALPLSAEALLGRESLATLDRLLFQPTALSAERRRELTALFGRMTAPLPDGESYRLEFRRSEAVGANAMALPSGIVVVTDGLVELARNDQEIAGVLAHEVGHVRGRHLIRHVLQNSVTGLLMAAVTGDILSVTSLSATLPTAIVDAKFSRDFEREADDAAVAYLQQERIPLRRYAEILARLQTEHDAKTKGEKNDGAGFRSYLSSHPATGERLRRIMAAEGGVSPPAR
ncbi:MAG: M48 family metallopeptidase [Geobacteraceae bacterium]|nr:M48 family metallopeptidase [Geobacteraceae bacterium]